MVEIVGSEMESYFSGKRLWGNDFTAQQIEEWFADEAEGYYNLTRTGDYSYGYHALNKHHGYSFLGQMRFRHVLGVGSAYGDELAPILSQCQQATILEPSEGFRSTMVNGVPVRYEKPAPSGLIPFASDTFDLITCFGVLHHIPNVSKVLEEFFRVLEPGGHALVREPIISMGDWRKPRTGLTKRERGIPLDIFREMVRRCGFTIAAERRCLFSLTSRLRYFVPGPVYNNLSIVALDRFLCSLPIWPNVYHARNSWQKLRPTAVFFVLTKPAGRL